MRCLGKLKTKEYEDKEDGSEGVVKHGVRAREPRSKRKKKKRAKEDKERNRAAERQRGA